MTWAHFTGKNPKFDDILKTEKWRYQSSINITGT